MAVTGMGTVLKFAPAGEESVVVGRLTSIGSIAEDSQEIDVTTLDAPDGMKEFVQGAKDPGQVDVEGFFAPGDAGQAALIRAYRLGAAGQAEVAFADGTTAVFSAFVKRYSIGSAEVDGAVGFRAVLRLTGGVTLSGI